MGKPETAEHSTMAAGQPGAGRGSRGRTGLRVAGWAGVVLVALVAAEALLVPVAADQWSVVTMPGASSPDEVVAAVATASAMVVAAWLAACALAALLSHLPGRVGDVTRGWAQAWTPAAARRVAAVLVGATVGSVLAPSTAAGGTAPPPPGFAVTAPDAAGRRVDPAEPVTAPALAEPGWTPSRPLERPQPSPHLVAGPSPRASSPSVVVLRGDSLWEIAARHLGPDASDAEVAVEWPRWYAANRAVIGDDPDLLLPGQVLQVPARAESVTR